MKLLIAIPVFNERKYLQDVLARVRQYHDQILYVDDGSTDGTAELLEAIVAKQENVGHFHLVRHGINKGYGQSIIDAFDFADRRGFEWVITMDCDEQHDPAAIPEFRKLIATDQWDVISGSRYHHAAPADDVPPGDRRAINAAVTLLMNSLFRFGITDAFCGFKAHRVSAMRSLRLSETGYAFPLQLWPRLAEAGARVTELPVRLIYKDLTRTFGGNLDDAGNRLRHYLDVLHSELHLNDEASSSDEADGERTDEPCTIS